MNCNGGENRNPANLLIENLYVNSHVKSADFV